MKQVAIALVIITLAGCQGNQEAKNNSDKEAHHSAHDAGKYKPGLGQYMRNIQIHHMKLWFAGKHQNWPLAGFEIHELEETFKAVESHYQDHKEAQGLAMIYAPLDSVDKAIDAKDTARFKNSYTRLTQTCNTCHQSNEHGFIKVKIPDKNPYSNQNFRPNP